MILDKETKEECQQVLIKWYGIQVTLEVLSDLLDGDEEITKSIDDFGPSDTVERENLIDLITRGLFKMHQPWPCNGDSDSYKNEFYSEFKSKAKEHNIILHWTE